MEPLDAKATWALADRIMSISYSYAVKMHESILAGKGAQGWNELKHAAEIRSAIGDALAEVEKLRGENERLKRGLKMHEHVDKDACRFCEVLRGER